VTDRAISYGVSKVWAFYQHHLPLCRYSSTSKRSFLGRVHSLKNTLFRNGGIQISSVGSKVKSMVRSFRDSQFSHVLKSCVIAKSPIQLQEQANMIMHKTTS